MVEALLDQRKAGKQLALITNSDWVYTRTLMKVSYEPFLPDGMKWWQLFDLVIVSACKPDFFSEARRPSYQVATQDGMLREVIRFERGGWYAGGNARMLEKVLGCRGEQVLYVGDHIFTDVNMAKKGLSWRTCMILQELEREVMGLAYGRLQAAEVRDLMARRDGCAPLSCYTLLHPAHVLTRPHTPLKVCRALQLPAGGAAAAWGGRHYALPEA